MIVGGGHALADQYRVRSRAGVVFDLDRAEYAGFRHLDDVIGQIGREFVVFVHVHLEVLQVARVDADHLGTGLAGAFDLFAGVRLHQHGHAELVRQVEQVLELGGGDRIMLDNFTPENTRKAVEMVAGRYETESSGGITFDTLRDYAECGVDFISVGALTHSVKGLDMSFKAC